MRSLLIVLAFSAFAHSAPPPIPKGCSTDSDCGDGLTCRGGACVPKGDGSCSTDDDCSGGGKCQDGKCQSPSGDN